MSAPATLRAEVAELRSRLARQAEVRQEGNIVSTGVPALDQLLPDGGLRSGWLVEYLGRVGSAHHADSTDSASGAGLLALAAARTICQESQTFVVIDRQRQFYPPAAAAAVIDLAQTIVLQPTEAADELWALDQVLRCPGVGAVWIACGHLDARVFRRLQLAAESGGTIGLLVRPAHVRRRPTWAQVQWLIAPQPVGWAQPTTDVGCISEAQCTSRVGPTRRVGQAPGTIAMRWSAASAGPLSQAITGWRLSVELVRCHGGAVGQSVQLELDEQTGLWREANDHAAHPLHSSTQLADSVRARKARRA